jgi:hypothetical protein
MDLLEIVEKKMLIIDPKSRISCMELVYQLTEIKNSAENDESYLLGTTGDPVAQVINTRLMVDNSPPRQTPIITLDGPELNEKNEGKPHLYPFRRRIH